MDPQNTTKKPITKALRDHTVVAASPPATQKANRTVDERLIGRTFLRGVMPLAKVAARTVHLYTLLADQQGGQDETCPLPCCGL
jgi:hypothetical protein